MLLTSMSLFSQVSIQMENDGGVYKIPCIVNGVKMKFIFDTGASTVSMSQAMAQFLLDGEYLSYEDIKGTGKSVVADGTIVNHALIVLRDIEIGGMHLHNIEATIIEGQNAPLLLGQSAIQELGRITIDGNRLIIHNVDSEFTSEDVSALIKEAYSYSINGNYDVAINILNRVNNSVGLDAGDMVTLAYFYFQVDDWNECISTCKTWINRFEKEGSDNDKVCIYHYYACSCFFNHDYNNAIIWFQKGSSIEEFSDYLLYAESLRRADRLREATTIFKKAIDHECKDIGVTINDIEYNKYDKNIDLSRLGSALRAYSAVYIDLEEYEKAIKITTLAAKCGDKKSIEFCNENLIDYKTTTSDLFD